MTTFLWEALRDKKTRYLLMESALHHGLAAQIRAMRAAKGWSRRELARRSGLSVWTIARFELSCAGASIHSLKKIVSAFDVGLVVRFASWTEFIAWLSSPVRVPPSFDDDRRLQELSK